MPETRQWRFCGARASDRARRAAAPAWAAALCAVAAFAAPAHAGPTAFAITGDNELLAFDTDNPGVVARVDVTGLQANDTLLGIDFRPAQPGQLFGVSDGNVVYRINTLTGQATAVGGAFSTDTLAGTTFGFDFNPVPDRIRLVSDEAVNLRLNPDTGGLAATDLDLAYLAGDANEGESPNITAVAYTNSDNDPATGTTLYGIDSALGVLVIQNPPNDGSLNTVGSLGVTDDVVYTGFDIVGANNDAFAASPAELAGTTTLVNQSTLYRINLSTGAATEAGTIGDGTEDIRALAVTDQAVPNPIPLPPAAFVFPLTAALAAACGWRMKRNAAAGLAR